MNGGFLASQIKGGLRSVFTITRAVRRLRPALRLKARDWRALHPAYDFKSRYSQKIRLTFLDSSSTKKEKK